jgi:hypothetical protein
MGVSELTNIFGLIAVRDIVITGTKNRECVALELKLVIYACVPWQLFEASGSRFRFSSVNLSLGVPDAYSIPRVSEVLGNGVGAFSSEFGCE